MIVLSKDINYWLCPSNFVQLLYICTVVLCLTLYKHPVKRNTKKIQAKCRSVVGLFENLNYLSWAPKNRTSTRPSLLVAIALAGQKGKLLSLAQTNTWGRRWNTNYHFHKKNLQHCHLIIWGKKVKNMHWAL